ncbi:hypothetical protein LUZ60_017438 [Juncus effusus]|nr:hypothetical protein LUZ60_017438 [Juncus effusus]
MSGPGIVEKQLAPPTFQLKTTSSLNNTHLYLLTLTIKFKLQNSFTLHQKALQDSFAQPKQKMSLKSKTSMVVAASISAVEALKDQAGLCRWNYALRSINQRAKNNTSCSLGRSEVRVNSNSQSSASLENNARKNEKAKKAEESLRTVMFLSNWGPN